MTIYKSISLAVFACIVFLGGFIVGEWATYDETVNKDIARGYQQSHETTLEFMDLVHDINNLSSITRLKSLEDLKEYKQVHKKYLLKKISRLEKQIEKEPYKEKSIYIKQEIERAKKVINDTNT